MLNFFRRLLNPILGPATQAVQAAAAPLADVAVQSSVAALRQKIADEPNPVLRLAYQSALDSLLVELDRALRTR